tara:strand:- start:335 stop:514 length:180 start_codon:yes stop_codon:yes gene_type:complete
MKSEITKQISETVDELERYELYLSNSVDEDTIHYNRVKIQKLVVEILKDCETLKLKLKR